MKQLPKKKERHRATHLELLGGVSSEALRRIREIAQKADLPLERVFRDVVAIGVSVVSDPEESPYQSLIAFRTGLATKQAELEHEQEHVTAKDGPVPGAGSVTLDFRESVLAIPPADTAGETGSNQGGSVDALERPGQWAEDAESAEMLS